MSLAEDLARLLKDTRRDLRAVLDEWAEQVPERLDLARQHIAGRLESEHRLLAKVRESLEAEDQQVTAAAARIAGLLTECARRHESLHAQVITARSVFLDEQDRQAFRPPALGYLPDLNGEVLVALLRLRATMALEVTDRWLSDVTGPRPPKLPRLYRLVDDLWSVREQAAPDPGTDLDELGDADPPTIAPEVVAAATDVVERTGLPARLSALLAEALTSPDGTADQQATAEILALAALWCFAPEQSDSEEPASADLATRIFGPRAVADTDGVRLDLPGWDGDDLVVVEHPDALQTVDPVPVTNHGGPVRTTR